MTPVNMINKLLKSSTLMTLAAMLSKSLVVLVITPIVAFSLNPEDMVVWFLYLSAISLVRMLDFGLSPTFIRVTSYLNSNNLSNEKLSQKISKLTFKDVYFFTRSQFLKMAGIGVLIGMTLGVALVFKPIMASTSPIWFYFGWLMVVVLASYSVYSNYILCFCMGSQDVADVQRVQVVANLIAGFFATIYFLTFSDIVLTGIFYLTSFPINVYFLKRKFFIEYEGDCDKDAVPILNSLTASQSIKSGVGLLLSTGLIEFSGVIGANLLVPSVAAKYQFGLQLIRAVNGFSHAPFTSKVPLMSKLYAERRINDLILQSRKCMNGSYLLFFFGYSFIFFCLTFLNYFGFSFENAPELNLWIVLGICFLVERLGSLHIQLYSLTNNIIWHKANAASGIVTVVICFIIYHYIPVPPQYIFPVSMFFSYLLTYVPISMSASSKEFRFNPFKFEVLMSGPYFLVMLLISILFVEI
ncbi:hypothetical protein [Shewanella algae]|uniref:hypothetical protein n=1 Tax=Shewanella algae TaxID=38313 RepID=UPI003007CA20